MVTWLACRSSPLLMKSHGCKMKYQVSHYFCWETCLNSISIYMNLNSLTYTKVYYNSCSMTNRYDHQNDCTLFPLRITRWVWRCKQYEALHSFNMPLCNSKSKWRQDVGHLLSHFTDKVRLLFYNGLWNILQESRMCW